jgi:hypothetical protein
VGILSWEGAETAAQEPTTLALDADPSGNSNTSVGDIQECVEVALGAVLEVDVVIMGVKNLLAWESPFVYDKAILKVTAIDVRRFQSANPRSNVINVSESVPNSSGRFYMGAADIGKAYDSGSGTLARLTLETIGKGLSPLELPQIDFNGDGPPDLGPTLSAVTFDELQHVGDVNGDDLFDGPTRQARIAVDASCQAPTPTPSASTTPAPTPTPLPDADGDGVPDESDQCPDTPDGTDVDASGCSQAQLDALKEEERQDLIDNAEPGMNLTATLDTVTAGGSTDLLAALADASGEPIPGVDVTFQIEEQPGSEADLEGDDAVSRTSDAEGVAAVRLNVGGIAGEISVSATAEGETDSVTISVVEAAGGEDGPGQGTPQATETPRGGSPGPGDDPGTDKGASSDGGDSTWIIAAIIGAALVLAFGTFGAWRFARHRQF